MRNNRTHSFNREQIGKIRGCLTLTGLAMVLWPMFATGDSHPITGTLTVQTICIGIAGALLIKLQVEAVLCKAR